ncbi:MAG TPA: ABC transporter permease [Candidatus Cloacimonadota bacterium]|nr:ABC transporter permease [Candidatus Cloacimonadota bacterium]HOQ80739.1 ABC transporter permease [Candidatus Cloacimonadota bacterium]HPK40458.1 ABC transporter permease [Candidatus Cloacimonadota bacterium]HPY95596.1 ABC transporter permease [Candidatus Cloacimonadota bacterium]HQB40164.1 ABC transporter permease [Candidatus Cloacimonadota bacterium]
MKSEEYLQKKKNLYSWVLSFPTMAWLVFFFLIPYIIIIIYSFLQTDIYDVKAVFSLDAYREVFSVEYLRSFYLSFRLALISTIVCLLLGYPAAYLIARSSEKIKNILLVLIIIPFLTNFIIRIFSWRIFLSPEGILNNLLIYFKFTESPLMLIRNDFAVILVMVYVYLPYMILPLYSNIEKMDFSLLDAAMDLGANKLKAFYKITLPLSKDGILAGSILVFIPALGAYIIPQLVGSQDSLYIGQIITYKIKNIPRNWPLASALSLILLLFISVLLVLFYFLHIKFKEKMVELDEN